MYLGYLLTNRVKIRYSQYQSDSQVWNWLKALDNLDLPKLHTSGLIKKEKSKINEIIIKISLSAKILDDQINELELDIRDKIEITIDNPSEDWLKSESQIVDLGKSFREILTNLRINTPNLNKIHLFYADPTAGAIVIGRQINPSMNPIVQLYEFDRKKVPNYQKIRDQLEKPTVYYAGSFRKKTMINVSYDLDIILYWSSKASSTIKEFYTKVGMELQRNWKRLRAKKVGWEIVFKGDFHIDVISGKRKHKSYREAYLYNREIDGKFLTSINKQVNYIKRRRRGDVIKLIKLWKKRK